MKQIFLLFFVFTGQLVFAQDTIFTEKKLSKLDINTFFSYYRQDGNHSAVTGGIGTEEMDVKNAGISLRLEKGKNTFLLGAHVDVITSASVDNIDFVISSASRIDHHGEVNAGYQRSFSDNRVKVGSKYIFGMESDFMSHGISTWGKFDSQDKTRSISVSGSVYFDDMLWGLLSPKANFTKTTVVYPSELRYKQWTDQSSRNSYNLNLNIRQDINKRLSLNVNSGVIYQTGLLATTFHRVYFKEVTGLDSLQVENLPEKRTKIPFGVAANYFATNNLVLKMYYRFYWDNFGILANTFSLETPVKLGLQFSIYPHIRFHHQSGSDYFKPYKQHVITETYFTSDYDLSSFWDVKTGIGVGFYPSKRLGKSRWFFNHANIRYSYFHRSDGLNAHIISSFFNFGR